MFSVVFIELRLDTCTDGWMNAYVKNEQKSSRSYVIALTVLFMRPMTLGYRSQNFNLMSNNDILFQDV